MSCYAEQGTGGDPVTECKGPILDKNINKPAGKVQGTGRKNSTLPYEPRDEDVLNEERFDGEHGTNREERSSEKKGRLLDGPCCFCCSCLSSYLVESKS